MKLPDFEKYRASMDEHNMSDAEKDEVIMAFWRIIGTFIDKAWDEGPVADENKLAQKIRDTSKE